MKRCGATQVSLIVAVAFVVGHTILSVTEMSDKMQALFRSAADTISTPKTPASLKGGLDNLMRSNSRESYGSMNEVTRLKLLPLDAPISSTFVTDLPFAPWISDDNCMVAFKDKNMAFSFIYSGYHFFDRVGVDIVVRLLEHRFECKASHLFVVSEEQRDHEHDKLFWVPPFNMSHINIEQDLFWDGGDPNVTMIKNGAIDGVVFLLPFLYSSYYAPISQRKGYQSTTCFVSESGTSSLPPGVQNIKLNRDWRNVLEQARWCDYIASSSKTGLVLAESLGIPAFATVHNISSRHQVSTKVNDIFRNSLYSPPRVRAHTLPLERHDVGRAQQMVETFPFHLFTTVTSEEKAIDNPAESPPPAPRNKTLVIVLGNLRGGEATWHSMYHNLLDENQADLALLIGEGGNTTLSPFKRAKYIWEFPEYEDWADAIDLIDKKNVTNWRLTVEPYVMKTSGVLGGIKGHTGSGAVIFMARHWLIEYIERLNLTDHYDRFVLTRSDHYYTCSHPLSILDARYLWVPSGEDYGGVTDRHWVMNRHHLIPALRVLSNLIFHHERLFATKLVINPELLIRSTWIMESLYPHQVRRFPRMMYTGFVAGVDGTRWKNQKEKWGRSEHGVHIKYISEHTFARCFCHGGHIFDYENNKSLGDFTNSWQVWTCTPNITTTSPIATKIF